MANPYGPAGTGPTGPTGSGASGWRAMPVVVVAAVLAVVLAATLGVAAASWSSRDTGGSGAAVPAVTSVTVTATPSPTEAAPSESATSTPEPTVAENRSTVPVYFVKDDKTGLRLYREFHPAKDSSVLSALGELAQAPLDADYSSLWKGATFSSYKRLGGTATVSVSGAADTTGSADGDVVTAALQQVVYTVTAVEQDAGLKVQVVADGKPLGKAVGRAPRIDTEGLVWLTSPVQAAITRSPVTLEGIASTFEATVAWEVHADTATGKVVANGSATAAEAGPARAAWKAKVTLPPGTYVVRAYAPNESSESGEEGAAAVLEDSKTITVEP